MSRAKNWCFTINNYGPDDIERLTTLATQPHISYFIYGRETGDSGTPHLQGYVHYGTRQRFTQVKAEIGNNAHLERSRGSPTQASDYCKKEGDFTEFGSLPDVTQGKRTDIDRYKDWLHEFHADNGRRPTEREIAVEHTTLWLRYSARLLSLRDMLLPAPTLVNGELKPWQDELYQELDEGSFDDRSITFCVDLDGGKGKSWFCRYCYTKLGQRCQILSIGKRDDLAHAIDPNADIFLFNIPRGQMEYLQYGILESLKDRMVFSPKYESTTKILSKTPMVVVFSNEHPDMNKMTEDRYNIISL